jgi:uncharacterized membrane protein
MDAVSSLNAPKAAVRQQWHVTPERLLIAVTLLALTLRFLDIGSRALWLDEAFSQWFSDHSFHYLWTVVPTYEAHPPFYYSLLKVWRSLAGQGHGVMRSLSVLFGTLTVPLIMVMAREQERQSATGRPLLRMGLAGFLAACSPMLIVLDQEARPYPLLIFTYSVSIFALLRLVRQFKAGECGYWSNWALLGVGAELTCWAHALGILYSLCLALALFPVSLEPPISRARLVRGIVTAGCVVLLYLPCFLMVSSRTQDWGNNWLGWSTGMLLQLFVLYSVPIEFLTVATAIAALAMLLLVKRALASTWASKGWNSDRLMLLLWLGPPLFAALISAAFVPVFLARTLSGTLVPAYLMIAGAIARTEAPFERRAITATICIILLPAAAAVALRPPDERWDLLSDYLARNVSAHDQVWLYPADSALPLDSLGRKIPGVVRPIPEPFPTLDFKGPIRAGWRATVSLTPAQAAGFASDPALKTVPVIWLVTRQSGTFDPHSDVPHALERTRKAGALQHWGYITVQPFTRR